MENSQGSCHILSAEWVVLVDTELPVGSPSVTVVVEAKHCSSSDYRQEHSSENTVRRRQGVVVVEEVVEGVVA